jgi:cytochrome P450
MSNPTFARPFTRPHPFTTNIDVSSDAFWSQDFDQRDESFARLRANAPVSWHPPRETKNLPVELRQAGFWAITSHSDIRRISLDHETFSSDARRGGQDFRADSLGHPGLEVEPTFLQMDPPEHTRFRGIMSAAFTPKGVSRLRAKIEQRAGEIVDRLAEGGEFDFVTDVAAKLPMRTIADLVGVPDSLADTFAEVGDRISSVNDPEVLPSANDRVEFLAEQFDLLEQIGVELVEHRRTHPADDIATALAHFEPHGDGRGVSAKTIRSTMALLATAGNDTTKNTTSASVVQLWRHPEQREWLIQDYEGRIGRSIEEFVRHASPVLEFARAVTAPVEIGGHLLEPGDKVVLFYCSGNRDEKVWPDAHVFDLQREVHPNLGFGGGGVHFCLGNGVAKAQISALVGRILRRVPHMEVGDPVWAPGDQFHAVKRLPVKVA